MYIYITVGTSGFLHTIKQEYPQEKMVIIENENGALILHETSGETVFNEPRQYQVLDGAGGLGNNGFFVLNNMPVTDEGRPILEYRFNNKSELVKNEPGFLAMRVLRPLKSNPYIILTVWENEASYNKWKNSASFKEVHDTSKDLNIHKSIFAGPSYVTKYTSPDKTI